MGATTAAATATAAIVAMEATTAGVWAVGAAAVSVAQRARAVVPAMGMVRLEGAMAVAVAAVVDAADAAAWVEAAAAFRVDSAARVTWEVWACGT